MANTSKLDQLRALREGRLIEAPHISTRVKEVAVDPPLKPGKPKADATVKVLAAKAALKRLIERDEHVPRLPRLAPPGQCPHCDARRADVAEAVRLHRAKKAPVILP